MLYTLAPKHSGSVGAEKKIKKSLIYHMYERHGVRFACLCCITFDLVTSVAKHRMETMSFVPTFVVF